MIDIKSVFRKIKNNIKLIVTIIVLYTLLNINITLATKLHNLDIDVDESFEEKAYKAGITYNGDRGTITDRKFSYNGLNIKHPFVMVGVVFLVIICIEFFHARKQFGLKLKNYEGQYYREIPYSGDPEDIYYMLDNLRLGGEIYGYKNYVAYYLIKWIKEGVIVKEAYKHGVLKKKERFRFKFSGQLKNASVSERRTFSYLKEAAGKDNRLGERSFKMCIRGKNSIIPFVFMGLNRISRKTLERKQYLKITLGNQFTTMDKEELTEKGKELAENIIKFRNFLLDFSLLNERDSMDLNLWDDLMVYAVLLGIADEVKNEFNILNPEYFDITKIDLETINLVNTFISTGGFYYIHGGGSFGGGSGGGTR